MSVSKYQSDIAICCLMFVLFPNLVYPGQTAINEMQKRELGRFEIGIDTSHPLVVEAEITQSRTEPEEGVWSLIIRDERDRILHRRNYPYKDPDGIEIRAASVDLPGGGRALLVTIEQWPSAPGTGISGQYFCFNKLDQLVPISGVLYPCTNSPFPEYFQLKELEGLEGFFAEIDHWTGNFIVALHHRIDFDGVVSDYSDHVHARSYPVKIDENEAQRNRNRNAWEMNTVKLYQKPSSTESKHDLITIQAHTEIEFIDASLGRDHWWIHVRIDGKEGYVTGFPDLAILGLPDAG